MLKIGLTLLCVVPLFISVIFTQNLECSNELKEHIDEALLTSLNSLIKQIENNTVTEDLLWKKEKHFSKVVFEDIYNYEKSLKDTSYKISTTLLNCYPVGRGRHLNLIAYYRQNKNSPKTLKMLLTIIAYKESENITFSTPLSYYTEFWKTQKIGSITYYFRDKINEERAEKFAKKNVQLARKFKQAPQNLKFFMVSNYQELLKLLGFDYYSESVGQLRDGYGVVGDEVIFSVMNNEDFSHDIFHYYSESIHDKSVRNWVTEEGLAYSWGNAYYTKKDGEMAEQKELLEILKLYIGQHQEIDLLSLFKNHFWTDKSGIYEALAPDFSVGRVISSLICDEVFKVHGMTGINQLLTIGSEPNHFDPFFQAIDQLIGINKQNFNEKVYQLIDNYNE